MKFLFKNKWFYLAIIWFVAGIYALIFRESTGKNAPPFPHFDKMAHALLFFAQMWLLAKAFLSEKKPIPMVGFWIFALICAVASELGQHFFTLTRQADFWDGVADMVGASVAIYLAHSLSQSYAKNMKKI